MNASYTKVYTIETSQYLTAEDLRATWQRRDSKRHKNDGSSQVEAMQQVSVEEPIKSMD